jgi:hypothetical protein
VKGLELIPNHEEDTMRKPIAWLACLALAVTPPEASALTIEIPVTPETMKTLPFTVTVRAIEHEDRVDFAFTVREGPKEGRYYSGYLMVRSRDGYVAEGPLEAIADRGPWNYKFRIAKDHLADSRFEFCLGYESRGVREPGGEHYLFNLKAFHEAARRAPKG